MTNKRIIIIFSVLLGLAVIVILCCTLFNAHNFEVRLYTDAEYHSVSEESVLAAAGRYEGSNLLFLSEKKVSQGIRESSPYIEKVDVERVFPNKIILHVTEREELFAIKLTDGENGEKMFMFDAKGYALRVSENNQNEDNNPAPEKRLRNISVVGITDSEIAEGGLKTGSPLVLKNADKLSRLTGVFESLMSFAEPDNYTTPNIKDFIFEVDVSNVREVVITTNAGGEGVKIYLADSDDVLSQMRVAVGAYKQLSDAQKTAGKINIIPDKSTSVGFTAVYSRG